MAGGQGQLTVTSCKDVVASLEVIEMFTDGGSQACRGCHIAHVLLQSYEHGWAVYSAQGLGG